MYTDTPPEPGLLQKRMSIPDHLLHASVTLPHNQTPQYDQSITTQEFHNALQKGKGTAPGPSTISYRHLQHLHPEQLNKLLDFFNYIWETCTFPDTWRIAYIIPILKPNKTPTEISSYRPISLTDCIGKVLERIINDRLKHYLEANNLITTQQHAYRAQHNTLDHVFHLHSDALTSITNKKYTYAIFLDMNKAFDQVWRRGLLYKLDKMGIKGKLYSYIRNFLRTGAYKSNSMETPRSSFPRKMEFHKEAYSAQPFSTYTRRILVISSQT